MYPYTLEMNKNIPKLLTMTMDNELEKRDELFCFVYFCNV